LEYLFAEFQKWNFKATEYGELVAKWKPIFKVSRLNAFYEALEYLS